MEKNTETMEEEIEMSDSKQNTENKLDYRSMLISNPHEVEQSKFISTKLVHKLQK
jgi:hypothetical protein